MFGNKIDARGRMFLTALRLNEGGIISAVLPLPAGAVVWLIEADGIENLNETQRRWIEEMEAFGHQVVVGTFTDLVNRGLALIREG